MIIPVVGASDKEGVVDGMFVTDGASDIEGVVDGDLVTDGEKENEGAVDGKLVKLGASEILGALGWLDSVGSGGVVGGTHGAHPQVVPSKEGRSAHANGSINPSLALLSRTPHVKLVPKPSDGSAGRVTSALGFVTTSPSPQMEQPTW